jgi:hypothetical protein
MGTWGVGLYSDDSAADLKNTLALLTQLPVDGDRLLDIVIDAYGDSVELTADGGPAFWLVVADQFERKGIRSARAFQQARKAIDTGADLRDLEARGMPAKDLKKRAAVLAELDRRLQSPRPERARPKATKPPDFVVDIGEVYAFPTMGRQAFNAWYSSWEQAKFEPDGWGAMLVLGRGRVFDWLPWCAVASLTVDPSREPSLDAAASAHLIGDAREALCVPRKTHLAKMKMRLLGKLDLDDAKAAAAIATENTPQYAVTAGWSFVSVVMSWRPGLPAGRPVADLRRSATP